MRGHIYLFVCPVVDTTLKTNAVKYVLFANTVLILIQYFLGQMSVLIK